MLRLSLRSGAIAAAALLSTATTLVGGTAAMTLMTWTEPAHAQFGQLRDALGKVKDLKKKVKATASVPSVGGVGDLPAAADNSFTGEVGSQPLREGATMKVAGPFSWGKVEDMVAWNGKLYVVGYRIEGIQQFDPATNKSRLFTPASWDSASDQVNTYALAAAPDRLYAVKGGQLFQIDSSGRATFVSETWDSVQGLAYFGDKLFVLDGEDLYAVDSAGKSRRLSGEWYNCHELNVVAQRLVAFCQDRLWTVDASGRKRQFTPVLSDYTGSADVNGAIYLVGNHNTVNVAPYNQASIFNVGPKGETARLSGLPAAWDIKNQPLAVAAIGGTLWMARWGQGGGLNENIELVSLAP